MTTITDVRIQVLEPIEHTFQWVRRTAPISIQPILISIDTDTGHVGECLTWLLSPSAAIGGAPFLARELIGKDPHHIEEISQKLTDRLEQPNTLTSYVDIALWDLLGKIHDEPIYRLLGAARSRIRAYASTVMYETDQEFIDLALECRDQGFNAYKIHPYGDPHDDIRLCRKLREAVGDTMDLMIDPVNSYDKRGAFKVARVLDELDFYWFEAPIVDTDVLGLRDLRLATRTPVAGGENVAQGLRAYPKFLSSASVDQLRSVGDWIGGITAMRKVSALCEAFNVPYEPHHYGTVHIQAAHLHVSLATLNGEFVEIPVPFGILDKYSADTMRPDADGFVTASDKPGLGYALDYELIEKSVLQTAKASEFVGKTVHHR